MERRTSTDSRVVEDSLDPAVVAARCRAQDYERIYGPLAQELLTRADSTAGTPALQQLLQRYWHTNAGRDAALRQAAVASDTGRLGEAAHRWQRLLSDPLHRRTLSAQQVEQAHRMVLALGDESHGRTVGDPASANQITLPYPIPVWQRSYHDEISADSLASVGELLDETVQQWYDERQERALPMANASRPIVVDDLLVFRDYRHLRAVDVRSGEPVWHYLPECSLVSTWQRSDGVRGGPNGRSIGFSEGFAGNALLHQLSTDGQRIYLIDQIEATGQPWSARPGPEDTTGLNMAVAANCLLALPLHTAATVHAQENAPLWMRGGTRSSPIDSLRQHYFLGPPAAANGRLYVMTESSGQVNLIALDAVTGESLSAQGIGLAEFPINDDHRRSRAAATPVVAGNSVICPTGVGLLVAVDAISGQLLWAYHDVDEDHQQAAGRWAATSIRSYGLPELPSQPIVADGRIYYLPDRSRYVHSVDLLTGVGWKVPRESSRFIAAVTTELLLLVGDHQCTAVSLADRSVLWQTPIARPAGPGILAAQTYLLPDEEGQVTRINLQDGSIDDPWVPRLLASATARLDVRTSAEDDLDPCRSRLSRRGGLWAYKDLLISVGPTGIAVFPQSHPMRERLTRDAELRELSPAESLAMATLELQAGHVPQSKACLRNVIRDPQSSEAHRQATALMQEILHFEVRSTSEPESLLDELETLADTSLDQARLLVDRFAYDRRISAPERLFAHIQRFTSLGSDELIPLTNDSHSVVSAAARIGELLADWRHNRSPADRQRLAELLESTQASIVASGDVQQARRFVDLFRTWPEIASLRGSLAERLITQGQLQEAEALLLENAASRDPRVAAEGLWSLSELYSRQNLVSEAAALLLRLRADYRDIELADGRPVEAYVGELAHLSDVGKAVRAQSAIPAPVISVRINEHRCGAVCASGGLCETRQVAAAHERVRRRIIRNNHRFLDVLDVGTPANHQAGSLLRICDSATGNSLGEIPLSVPYPHVPAAADDAGHLLTFGGGRVHAVSLLERRTLWELSPEETSNPRRKMRIGPRGTSYCVIQQGSRLLVVHPVTGRLIWQRDHVAHDAGLNSNEMTGIIGDEEHLVVFEADQVSYTVYQTSSGTRTSSGRIPQPDHDSLRLRHAAGRCLWYVADCEKTSFLRIWDPVAEQRLLDEPLFGRMTALPTPAGQLAYISADGRFCVVNPQNGRPVLDMWLAPHHLDGLTSFTLSEDQLRYGLDLVQDGQRPVLDPSLTCADDLEIPTHRVRGLFLSINRPSGQIEWEDHLGEASVIQFADARVPVFVLARRRRDSHPRNPGTLQVEVRNLTTGRVLQRQENLLRNRIVHCGFNPLQGHVTLTGVQARIDIRFGPQRNDLLIHASAEGDELPGLIR